MANWRLVTTAVPLVLVMAAAWGLYFFVTSVAGFDFALTIGLVALTAIVLAGFVGLQLLVRRSRAEPQKEIGLPAPDRRFGRLVIGTVLMVVVLWSSFLVVDSVLGFGVGDLFAPLFLTVVLIAGDIYIWFGMFRKP